jgi:hypothetical protein
MKKIAVDLQREAYLQGQIVRGYVNLVIDKPVKARCIKLEAVGVEDTAITVSRGKSSYTYTEENHIIKENILLHSPQDPENLELEPGNYNFKFEFKIPDNALSSYKGKCADVKYWVKARVDVPLWLDIVDKKNFYVYRSRNILPNYAQPARLQSENYLDLQDDKPGFHVELNKTGYAAGEMLEGIITFGNVATSKIRKVKMRLLGVEYAQAGPYSRINTTREHEIELIPEHIMEAETKRFSFAIPKNISSSYEGKYSHYRWAFEAQLDLPLKFDIEAKCSLFIIQ